MLQVESGCSLTLIAFDVSAMANGAGRKSIFPRFSAANNIALGDSSPAMASTKESNFSFIAKPLQFAAWMLRDANSNMSTTTDSKVPTGRYQMERIAAMMPVTGAAGPHYIVHRDICYPNTS